MRRRIDRTSDRAVYQQLADILREHIHTGTIAPGRALPSIPDLIGEYDLGREAVRRALAVLRGEGLIETISGIGSIVRDRAHTETVQLHPGDTITTRMPTPAERRDLGISEGIPIFVIRRGGGEQLHAGDRARLEVHDRQAGGA